MTEGGRARLDLGMHHYYCVAVPELRYPRRLMLCATANGRKERSDRPANRRGGAEEARAAGRRMGPRGQAARRAGVAGRSTGEDRMA